MKMKRIATHSVAVLVGVIAGIILSGCAGTRIKRLSGPEFVNRAQQIEQVSSFSWMTYIGSSRQRAYLEFGHPAFVGKGTRTTVFWTPMSELPDDIVQELKEGNPPWKPWEFNTNKTERTIEFTVPK